MYYRCKRLKSQAKKHFTLLEMLMAMVIFALIMAAVGSAVATVAVSWQRIGQHGEYIREFCQLENLADTAFRNAFIFHWPDSATGEIKTYFSGGQNELSLTYRHRIGVGREGGLRFLYLYLNENNELVAEYRPQPRLQEVRTSDLELEMLDFSREEDLVVEEEVLLREVADLEFFYAWEDVRGIVWHDSWDLDEYGDQLPLAILMRITNQRGEVLQFLRRIGGNSAIQKMDAKQ